MFQRANLPTVLLALALAIGCGGRTDATHAQVADASAVVQADGPTNDSDGAPRIDGDTEEIHDAGNEPEAGTPFACGYNEIDGGPNICTPSQYCQITCGTTAACTRPIDGATCPAMTVACDPTDVSCAYDWFSGTPVSSPSACCEEAFAVYTCVDALPPQPTSIPAAGTTGPCTPHGEREYLCSCQPT
jgi:hypothetical protein